MKQNNLLRVYMKSEHIYSGQMGFRNIKDKGGGGGGGSIVWVGMKKTRRNHVFSVGYVLFLETLQTFQHISLQ